MIRKLKTLIAYRNHLKESGGTEYQVSFVTEEHMRMAAQKLHAKVYLERQFIELHHIASDGRMNVEQDPYQEHSDYFIVHHVSEGESSVVATARQIKFRTERGHDSFPTITKLKIYPQQMTQLQLLDPNRCVEISGLAKERGHSSYAALLLYRAMWQHSVRTGHEIWLMAVDAKVYAQLKFLFGEALSQIGEPDIYMGSEVVPAMLDVQDSLGEILKATNTLNPLRRSMKLEMVRFFVRGLDPILLSAAHSADLHRILKTKPARTT